MKKLLLLSLVASLAILTACNKQEIEQIQPEVTTPAEMVKNTQTTAAAMTAAFTINNENGQINENETLLLKNQSTNAVSYEWDFGNGDKSTEATPSYQYKIHGYYTISLKTTDARGNVQETSQDINVLCIFGGGSHDE